MPCPWVMAQRISALHGWPVEVVTWVAATYVRLSRRAPQAYAEVMG